LYDKIVQTRAHLHTHTHTHTHIKTRAVDLLWDLIYPSQRCVP